ncbi:MAG: hypothetical protein B6D38_05680 [Anaerolineae bacterium UTCFX1]|nr:MAG: hypothetical protein B6D38_05680 [Anaerolineae bacterium UTCFX1]
MSPEEIFSFYEEVHLDIKDKNISSLADKIYLPISQCGRNKGDKIETKDEFVERFNEIFSSENQLVFLNANLENTFINMYGVLIGDVWYSSICKESTCSDTKILIIRMGDYCSFRSLTPTTVEGATAQAAHPDYPESQFVFGDYQLDSYQSVGGSLMSREDVEKFQSVSIEKNKYTTDTACHFGCTCPSPEYEFNKPFYGKGRASWYGIPSIGELIVICGGKPLAYFDILSNDEIGYYADGYYFNLKHK